MEEVLDYQPKTSLKKIFSAQSAWWATIIGGPLVFCYFLWHNYRVFGKPQQAVMSWLWVIPCLGLAYLLPESFPVINKNPAVISIAIAGIGMIVIGIGQAEEIKTHLDMGGKYQSGWMVFIVAISGLIITVSLLLAVLYVIAPEEFEYLTRLFS